MLVSPPEALAQDLRRQDLLTQALHEHATRQGRRPGMRHPVLPLQARRSVGTALIRIGACLEGRPRLEPTVEPAPSTPPA